MATETYETMISFSIEGQYAAIVQHWTGDEDGTGDDFLRAQALITALTGGVMIDHLAALLADDCFISSIRARRVGPAGGNTAVVVFATGDHVGTFGGHCEPQQVAACIIWVSASSINNRTGRNFIPGVSEDATDDARFNSTYISAVQTWVDDFIGGIAVSGFTAGMFPSIYDRALNNAHTISYGYLSPKVGTQRRRLVPV